jgi:hypothetical protein
MHYQKREDQLLEMEDFLAELEDLIENKIIYIIKNIKIQNEY